MGPIDIEDRTAIVTGGASGLGAAVVHALARSGVTPVSLDLRPPPGEVAHVLVDLADPVAAEAATRDVIERHGNPVAVVTCAGTDACGAFDEVDAETWNRVVAVNLLGTAAVIRAALPALEQAGGRIVTVASTLGLRALPHATAYCASKFGVVGFSRALTLDLAGRVPVTLLVPGGMATSFFDGRPEQYRPGPNQRLNAPDAVASAVLFALAQPPGCEIRELVICPEGESSWP
jgi:NAD(P)-dependent dehydrogenase (short-subunit alcohol dehydrogenase family)